MTPGVTSIRVVSGFYFNRKAVKTRTYTPMSSIAVPGQSGTIIPLEVIPASDGSGTYVLVVALQDPEINVGTVDVALTYNLNPPVLHNGDTTGFQADINGNLKVALAQTTGSTTIGTVNQGVGGASAWAVDPSGVTSPVAVEAMPSLPAGTNAIGGVYQAPTSSASFALMPGSSPSWESSRIIKASGGNLYNLNIVTGAVPGFLMTFDATSVPDDGPVNPIECVPVAANSFAAIRTDGMPPDHYSDGIVVVFSVTGPFTKTTTSVYGSRPYGHGSYGSDANAVAFFKWSVQ